MYIFTKEVIEHINAKIAELERLEYCGDCISGYYFDSCLNIDSLIADELHDIYNALSDYLNDKQGKGYNMVIFDDYKAFKTFVLEAISKNIKIRKSGVN